MSIEMKTSILFTLLFSIKIHIGCRTYLHISRAEGKYPNRGDLFAPLRLWRESRPDLFWDTKGVLIEEREEWQKVT